MKVLETDRLIIRHLEPKDAAFILELLNQPSWLQYIGDRGVETIDDAAHYIKTGPMDMYRRLGFGLFAVELKETGDSVGICGLIKRDSLEDVDIGFAFLERHFRKGYALESAKAVMGFAASLNLTRVVAITTKDNVSSQNLLSKQGFYFDRFISLESGADQVCLYVHESEKQD